MNQSLEQQVQNRCLLQVDRENCEERHLETPDGHTARCNDINNTNSIKRCGSRYHLVLMSRSAW